jgi:hypothetical protein
MFLVQKGSFDAEKKTVQLQSSLVGNASKVRDDQDHVSIACWDWIGTYSVF